MKGVPSVVCICLTAACLLVVCFGLGCNANMAGADQSEWQVKTMRVTAYCPCAKCCGEYSDGITANGHKIINGDRFVAADSRFSFDTQMVIPGYNNGQVVKVYDRGGAIQGDRLDVFFNTHQEALNWGIQYLDVRVLVQ